MKGLVIVLVVFWLGVALVTFEAFSQQGMIAGELFVADIKALNWRAQFNVDFLTHLLLLGTWVAWRHRFSPGGLILALACVLGGGLVSLVYIFIASIGAKGDAHILLLGKNLKRPEY